MAQTAVLKVGISEPVNTVLAVWMADAAGLYAANGLKVEIANMQGGSRGAQELAAGRIDVMHVGLSSVVRLNRAGADLRLIGSLSNVIRFTFFSAPGVKTAADLKGGVVGVSAFGSESDATVTLALRKLGLTRDDVVLKEFGGGRRRLDALKAGEMKATSVNEPIASLAREQGMHVLVDLVPDQIPWLFSGLAVQRARSRDGAICCAGSSRQRSKATIWRLSDAARAKEVLARETRITDPKIIDIGYRDFQAQTPHNAELSIEGARNILALFPASGSQNLADYMDRRLSSRACARMAPWRRSNRNIARR